MFSFFYAFLDTDFVSYIQSLLKSYELCDEKTEI